MTVLSAEKVWEKEIGEFHEKINNFYYFRFIFFTLNSPVAIWLKLIRVFYGLFCSYFPPFLFHHSSDDRLVAEIAWEHWELHAKINEFFYFHCTFLLKTV